MTFDCLKIRDEGGKPFLKNRQRHVSIFQNLRVIFLLFESWSVNSLIIDPAFIILNVFSSFSRMLVLILLRAKPPLRKVNALSPQDDRSHALSSLDILRTNLFKEIYWDRGFINWFIIALITSLILRNIPLWYQWIVVDGSKPSYSVPIPIKGSMTATTVVYSLNRSHTCFRSR